MSAGREKDPIWFYFNFKFDVGKKGSRTVCRKCKTEMQGLLPRIKNHFSICANQSVN